jgi:hypothetical protein
MEISVRNMGKCHLINYHQRKALKPSGSRSALKKILKTTKMHEKLNQHKILSQNPMS